MEDNEPVIYIIGYKKADGDSVEIKYFTIDQEFFTIEILNAKGLTLQQVYQDYMVDTDNKAKSQFYINSGVVHKVTENVIGYVPIYNI